MSAVYLGFHTTRAGTYAGDGVISGSPTTDPKSGVFVVADDNPVSVLVMLSDQISKQLIAITRSAADGSFAFRQLNRSRPYFVIAFDPSKTYNAVVADNLIPVPE